MKRFSKLICVITSVIMLAALIPGLSFASEASDGRWVGSWSTAPIKSGIQILNGNYTDYLSARTTVRSTITPTLSGNTIRLKFSNIYGSDTVYINETTIAVTGFMGISCKLATFTLLALGGVTIETYCVRSLMTFAASASTSPVWQIRRS